MRCFWKRLTLELVGRVKQIALPNVGGHRPVGGLNRTKTWRKGEFALCLSWDSHFQLPLNISTPGSWAFGPGLGLTSLALRLLLSANHTSGVVMMILAYYVNKPRLREVGQVAQVYTARA